LSVFVCTSCSELYRYCLSLETVKSLRLSNSNMTYPAFSESITASMSTSGTDTKQALVSQVIGNNFANLLKSVCFPGSGTTTTLDSSTNSANTQWTASSPHKAAFEVLVRSSVKSAWSQHAAIFGQVIVPQVQPKARAAEGTSEAINASYVSDHVVKMFLCLCVCMSVHVYVLCLLVLNIMCSTDCRLLNEVKKSCPS
jgi:hypothetical protein